MSKVFKADADKDARERRWVELCRRLDADSHWLATRGAVVKKKGKGRGRNHYWVLRYAAVKNDKQVLRTVYLGREDDMELVQRIQDRLGRYRQVGAVPQELCDLARLAGAIKLAVQRLAVPKRRHQ